MSRIMKFQACEAGLSAPLGKVLLVAQQGGGHYPTLWVEVEEGAPDTRYFVLGTGWDVANGLVHVGSAICGTYVWHIYREPLP